MLGDTGFNNLEELKQRIKMRARNQESMEPVDTTVHSDGARSGSTPNLVSPNSKPIPQPVKQFIISPNDPPKDPDGPDVPFVCSLCAEETPIHLRHYFLRPLASGSGTSYICANCLPRILSQYMAISDLIHMIEPGPTPASALLTVSKRCEK